MKPELDEDILNYLLGLFDRLAELIAERKQALGIQTVNLVECRLRPLSERCYQFAFSHNL